MWQVLPVHILLGLIAWDSWRLREFLGPNASVITARRIAKELITEEREVALALQSDLTSPQIPQSLPYLMKSEDIPFGSDASCIFKGIAEVCYLYLS